MSLRVVCEPGPGVLYPCTDKKKKMINTQHRQGGSECNGAKLRSG